MKRMNRFQLYTCSLIQQSAPLHPPSVDEQETAKGLVVGTVGTAHIEKKEVVGPAHQEEEKEQCKGQRTLS